MGKRKSSKPMAKRAKYTLAKEFDCPFCNFRKCVETKIFRSMGYGTIKCRVCNISHESKINQLTEAADIYCDWLDACEKVNEEESLEEDKKSDNEIKNDSESEDEIKFTKKIKKNK